VRILIADDNPDDIWLFREAFQLQAAVELVVAKDGREALETIPQEQADLVMLDLHLPLLNAHEILERLKQSQAFPKCPIVVVSSEIPSQDRHALIRGGVHAVLEKPVDLEGFQHMVSLLLTLIGQRERS
jgi:CheY-like chemotaxis protein